MARRRLDIDINTDSNDRGAKNTESALNRVTRAAGKMGSALHSGFNALATAARRATQAIAAIGAAALATATLAVRSFMKSDDAMQNLIATSKSYGDNIDAVIPKYKKLSQVIQANTRIGDDEVLSLIEQLRNLGVMPDKMDDAVKGTIGLSKSLRMDLGTAARVAALALDGEFEMLSRYSPEIRTATTDTEKMAVAQNLMAKGYKQAEEQAGNLTGRYVQFKNKLGDLFEELGQGISNALDLKGVFEGLTKAIDTFINSGAIAAWSEKFKKIRQDAEAIFTAITKGGKGAEVWAGVQNVIIGTFRMAGGAIITIIAQAAPAIGAAIGRAFIQATKGKGTPEQRTKALGELVKEGHSASDLIGTAAGRDLLSARIDEIQNRQYEEQGGSLAQRLEGYVSKGALAQTKLGLSQLGATAEYGRQIGARPESVDWAAETSKNILSTGDVAAQGATADTGRGAVINYLADRLGDAQAGSAEAKTLNAQLQAVMSGNQAMIAQMLEIMKTYELKHQQLVAEVRNMRR